MVLLLEVVEERWASVKGLRRTQWSVGVVSDPSIQEDDLHEVGPSIRVWRGWRMAVCAEVVMVERSQLSDGLGSGTGQCWALGLASAGLLLLTESTQSWSRRGETRPLALQVML